MSCPICAGEPPLVHPFLIQIRRVGSGVGATATNYIKVRGLSCASCNQRLRRLRTIRYTGFGAMLGAAGCFLLAAVRPSWVLYGLAAALAVVFVLTIAVVLVLQRGILRKLAAGDTIERLRRSLPDAPGIIQWSQISIFLANAKPRDDVLDLGSWR